MWRIMFKDRKHCDIENASSSKEAKIKAEASNPTFGKALFTIIDPPSETVRHCPGCGRFMAKDYLNKFCRECKSQIDWRFPAFEE